MVRISVAPARARPSPDPTRSGAGRQGVLADAVPEDEWFREVGLLEDEANDEEGFFGRRDVPEAYAVVGLMDVTQIDGRPVIVTGGRREDLSTFDDPASPEVAGGAVRVWDLRTGHKVGKTMVGSTNFGIWSITAVETTTRGPIAIGGGDSAPVVDVWDLSSGDLVTTYEGHRDGMFVVASEVDGRVIAVSGSHDGTIQFWDALTGERLGDPLTGHEGATRGLAITELGDRPVAVTASDDGIVRIWDLATHERSALFPPATPTRSARSALSGSGAGPSP